MLFSRHFKLTITYILPILIVMLAGGVFWYKGKSFAAHTLVSCSFDNTNGRVTFLGSGLNGTITSTALTVGGVTVTISSTVTQNASEFTANIDQTVTAANGSAATTLTVGADTQSCTCNNSYTSISGGTSAAKTLTDLGMGAANRQGGVIRSKYNPVTRELVTYNEFSVDQPIIYDQKTGQLNIRGANFSGQEKVAVDGVEVSATVLGPRDITASAPDLAAGTRIVAVFDVNQRVEVNLNIPEVPDDSLPPHIRLTPKEETGPQKIETTGVAGPVQFLTAGGQGASGAELSVTDTRNAEGGAGSLREVRGHLISDRPTKEIFDPNVGFITVPDEGNGEGEPSSETDEIFIPGLGFYHPDEEIFVKDVGFVLAKDAGQYFPAKPTFGVVKASPLTISLNVSDYGRLEVRTGGGGLISSNSVGPGVLPISIPDSENGTFVMTLFDSNGMVVWSLKAVVQDGALLSLDSGNLPAESKMYPKTAGRAVALGVDAVDAAGNFSFQILPFKGEAAPEPPEEGPFFEIDVEAVAPFYVTLAKIPGIFEVDITDSEAPEAFSGLPFRITMARAPVVSVSLEDTDPFLVSLRGPIIKEVLDELVIEILDEEQVGEREPFEIFIEEEPLVRKPATEEPITIEIVEEEFLPVTEEPLIIEIVEEPLVTGEPEAIEEEITISIEEVPEFAVAEDSIVSITIREVTAEETAAEPVAQEEPLSIVVEPVSESVEASPTSILPLGEREETGVVPTIQQAFAPTPAVSEPAPEEEGFVAKLKKPFAVIAQAVQLAVEAVADFLGFGSGEPGPSSSAPVSPSVASVSATWSAIQSVKAPVNKKDLFAKIRSIFPSKAAVAVRPAGHRVDISATWDGYEARNLDTSAWPAMHYGATSAYRESIEMKK
jgi:hypothetical protein